MSITSRSKNPSRSTWNAESLRAEPAPSRNSWRRICTVAVKNPVRKLRELLIARRLEAELSKQRILELYLNVIEWGDGIYGAEAAARTYFGKSAAAVSPSEAALLAASIANPRVMNPAHVTARLRRRQSMVLRRMGAIEPPPVIAATPAEPTPPAQPIEPVPSLPPVEGLPTTLPGQSVPPPKKPGGGGQGS